ncbi:copper ABC transporter ATP-binding protein [Pelagibaculum spongiae]|uniref:Copper ABC transporter ATP-binding protein n=2 Tax=Pelagibaculum spongiae TaxID=2080658 RepID=A0A2V1H268_9GAMM|nr:copper ABC transporter ATP-binding protein [Pelagibaculum spongiae]
MDQVAKSFGSVSALKSISLQLEAGQLLGLFGHNGAGKTTSIKLILGLLSPDDGQVRVFGQQPDHGDFLNQRAKIGFLQENVSFYDQLTGEEVLRYFAKLKKRSKKECMPLLEQLGLAHAAKRRVAGYSKGMRQRLGLAQALLGEPKLLLLDEPTVGLDPLATREFYQTLNQLKHQGCSVILCSHVLPGVEQYIDRAIILGQGEMLASGDMKELRHQADLPVQLDVTANQLQLSDYLQQHLSHQSGNHYQFKAPLTDKLKLNQQLSQLSSIEDFHWHLPSLEDLYNHFCNRSAS